MRQVNAELKAFAKAKRDQVKLKLQSSLEPPRCRKVSISLGGVTGLEVGSSAILVGKGKIWVEPDRLIVVTNRLVEVAFLGICRASKRVGKSEIWVKSNRIA